MTDRKKLLNAALEIFAETGMQNASLQAISEKAGLDPAIARAEDDIQEINVPLGVLRTN